MFFSTPIYDLNLFLLINQHWRNGVFDALMPLLSATSVLMLLLALAFLLTIRNQWKKQCIYFVILFIGMGLSDFSTSAVKNQIHRVRPLNAIAGTYFHQNAQWHSRAKDFVRTKEAGSSYPSAHAANTMCLALLAMLLWPSLKRWPLIIPAAVGYSRVYLGKHYPTDVLAGWLWGIVIAGAVWLLFRQLQQRYPKLNGTPSSLN